MSTYIGMTIGPIYKTLMSAKKTRALWLGSYIFSNIMREIIEEFYKGGRGFILPYIDNTVISERNGIGMFHDKCIFKSKPNDLVKLRTKANEILGKIGDKLGNRGYCENYFQVSWCELEEKGDYKQVVDRMCKVLDAIELHQKFIPEENGNFLSMALEEKAWAFYADAGRESKRFPSIPEIATRDLDIPINIFDAEEEDEKIYEKIDKLLESEKDKRLNKKGPISLKKHHKYIAIVKADGDNLSKAIASLSNDSDFRDFSKKLLIFSKSAHKIIEAYGGTTVFAGGDDLLFFAPLKNGPQNIFSLVNDLSGLYQQTVNNSTLSFGVSLSYYKYPLYEALQAGEDLLAEAKKGDKNAVALRLLKHSGKEIEAVFGKPSLYNTFLSLIQKSLSDAHLFTSLMTTLMNQSCVLAQIGANKKRVENFLANTFNEEIHKKNAEFMKTLGDIIYRIYSDAKLGDENAKCNALFAMLKTATFLQED